MTNTTTTTNTTKTKMTSYVSAFVIHIGPATVAGRLVGIRNPEPKEEKTSLVSPAGEVVKQVYRTDLGEIFERSELGNAVIDEDGATKVLDAEALKAARESVLPKNIMNVTVHPRADVDDQIFPSDNNAYVFYPDANDPANKLWADALTTAIAKDDMAYMGVVNLRNHEGLFRLSVWRGHMIIQKMLYPEMLKPHEFAPIEDTVTSKKLAAVMAELVTPFVPEEYQDSIAKAKAEVVAAAEAGTTIVVSKPKANDAVFDLDAALAAFANFKEGA